jgi:hypothetical protein
LSATWFDYPCPSTDDPQRSLDGSPSPFALTIKTASASADVMGLLYDGDSSCPIAQRS